jgi:hypothetical protein
MDLVTDHFSFRLPHTTWARAVSNVLSPPVVWAVLAFPMAYHAGKDGDRALSWALMYGLLVCLLPMIYIAWNVKRGHISDLHMQIRRQRIRPLIVTIVGTSIALGALILTGAPPLMPMFALFTLLQIALLTLITVVWQISFHAMSISGAVIAAGALYGAVPAFALAPLVVLVGGARLKLRRHTLSQVIAGALVGAVMTTLLFTLA